MNKAFIIGENIISPLGFTAEENFRSVSENISGVKTIHDPDFIPQAFSGAKISKDLLERNFSKLHSTGNFTRLEKMMILSIQDAVTKSGIDPSSADILFVISTTKGNIALLDTELKKKFEADRIHLWKTARIVSDYFKNNNTPVTISNACISGVAAILYAAGEIKKGKFKHAVVCGVDELTKFVVSGFQSFLAISEQQCKPFDAARNGISLGEAAATVVISNSPLHKDDVEILGGATSNDANHISGPSRTGEGLVKAIEHAFAQTNTNAEIINYISAHGTATPYNDEMEAIAFSRTGLEKVPINSFKGYYGHTLGAAGTLETVLSDYSMKNNLLIKSLGYANHGVSKPVHVISENKTSKLKTVLKVASGFGGCNAAMILKKNED